jgi:hypothetical protein
MPLMFSAKGLANVSRLGVNLQFSFQTFSTYKSLEDKVVDPWRGRKTINNPEIRIWFLGFFHFLV